MVFPAQATDAIFFLIAILLVIMPIATIIASMFITRVFLSDTDRPRNKIIKRMVQSAWSITSASVLVSALSIDFIRHAVILHEPISADFGGVLIAFVFLILEIQPFLNYWELRKLRYPEVISRSGVAAETQNQREDREFGTERRLLEVEHADADETPNQKQDRIVGDMLRSDDDEAQERFIQELTDKKD